MKEQMIHHEIISSNPDVEVRFYLSVDEGGYVPPHWHDSLEIIYLLEGKIHLKYENSETDIGAGEIALINSREIHSFRSMKNRALVLQVPENILCRYIPEYEKIFFYIDMNPVKPSEVTKIEHMKKIFWDMQVVYEVRPKGYLLRFNSLLFELLYMLIHSYSVKRVEKEISRTEKNRERIKAILCYLDDNHAEQINIRETASYFGYNVDYFSRLLKRQVGLTAGGYLHEIRMNYIYMDIMKTDIEIGRIMERHGCLNYKAAMRWFRERYGCTPKELRKRSREKNEKQELYNAQRIEM